MSLSGKLEDLPLPQLLQVLSTNRSTGKLTVTRRDGHGVVLFRDGKVVYAATNAARETIGNLLVMQRLVTASALAEALERQGRSKEERRLGSVLIEMGAVDQAALEHVMKEQVEGVLLSLFQWRTGFVKFEKIELPEQGEVQVDASDFLLREGVQTDRMVFEVMTQLLDQEQEEERALLAALEAGTGGDPRSLGVTLKEIMADIRSPAFTGEVTLSVLRFASRFVDRGAVFLHSTGKIKGMGQFGFDDDDDPTHDRVRRIEVPADEPSVFLEVLEKRSLFRGRLEQRYWNIYLARQLGHEIPNEVAVVPMVVGERPVLLLYCDNLPSGRPIPDLDELELLMLQAGLALEKSMLEARLEAVELRSSRGSNPPLGAL